MDRNNTISSPVIPKLEPVDYGYEDDRTLTSFECMSYVVSSPGEIDCPIYTEQSIFMMSSLHRDSDQVSRVLETPLESAMMNQTIRRAGTPARVIRRTPWTEIRKRLDRIPSRRGTSLHFPGLEDDIPEQNMTSVQRLTLHDLWEEFVSTASYFGPGILLSILLYCIIMSLLNSFGSGSGGDLDSHTTVVSDQYLSLGHGSSSYSSNALQRLPVNPFLFPTCNADNPTMSLAFQCRQKILEHEERARILGDELENMRTQCTRKLAQKDLKLLTLMEGIYDFRRDYAYILKTTLYKYISGAVLTAFLITAYIIKSPIRQ